MAVRLERFICDEMLTRLARWLRAAGYDTELAAKGMNDQDLMAKAISGNRLLLTRDRKFLERRNSEAHVFLIDSGRIEDQVNEITRPLGINWLKAPFSRCLMDNAVVTAATEMNKSNMPPDWKGSLDSLKSCPDCGRLFWTGSHTRRMLARLEAWSAK